MCGASTRPMNHTRTSHPKITFAVIPIQSNAQANPALISYLPHTSLDWNVFPIERWASATHWIQVENTAICGKYELRTLSRMTPVSTVRGWAGTRGHRTGDSSLVSRDLPILIDLQLQFYAAIKTLFRATGCRLLNPSKRSLGVPGHDRTSILGPRMRK
ncbi:hypothetical protein ACGC1H_000040 [Rhizoctonia solani]